MDFQNYQDYLFPALLIGYFAWRFYSGKKVKSKLPELLKNGAIIVDVRSAAEFKQCSNPMSRNIPLGDLNSRYKELDKNKTIILCCASGSRSGMAVGILKAQGFANVMNAGSWTNTLNA